MKKFILGFIIGALLAGVSYLPAQVDEPIRSSEYEEDDPHVSGDVGIFLLGVENEDQATFAAGDKDYIAIAVTPEGNIIVKQEGTVTVTGGGGSQFAIDTALGATDLTTLAGVVRDDSLTTLTEADGDVSILRVSSTGALHVTGGGGGTEYTEDEVTASPIVGAATMMEMDAQLSAVTPAGGDWISLRGSDQGALWVAIADSSGDPITSFGGGTQQIFDAAADFVAAGADTITPGAQIRDDVLSTLTPIAGDFVPYFSDAFGANWTALSADDGARIPADSTAGLKVDLGADNDVTATLDAETTKVIGTVRIASGGVASGSIASGAIASGAIASGAVATGAFAVGAFTAGNASPFELEDADSADADAGAKMMARRTATPADTSGADLDYEMLQMDNGRLWASTLITGDALTALQLIDDMISGSEAQVDVIVFPDNEPFDVAQMAGATTPMTTTQADNLGNTLDSLNTSTFLYGFDGATWDRLHATAGDLHIHDGGNVITVDGTVTANPASGTIDTVTTVTTVTGVTDWGGAAIPLTTTQADGLANTLDSLNVSAFNYVYNGTTFDIVREGAVAGSLLVDGTGSVFPVTNAGLTELATAIDTQMQADIVDFPDNEPFDVAQIGGAAVVAGACQREQPLFLEISQTANTQLVAGTASERIYICSFHVVSNGAEDVALISGTGTVCDTSAAGVEGFGGATAATGWQFAANGGIMMNYNPMGHGRTDTDADNLCLFKSASGQMSGGLSYVSIAAL